MAKKRSPLGSGARFRECEESVRARGGAYDPAAVCAAAGRRKYGQAAMSAMSAAGRRRNPLAAAEKLYEAFHGRAATRVDELEFQVHSHSVLAQLGQLIELRIVSHTQEGFVLGPFRGVRCTSSEDGGQIYFVGGDQAVDLERLGHADDLPKDHVLLGVAVGIVYHTSKHFHNFEPSDYDHEFGEETGEYPVLGYDTRNRVLYLVGGAYQVKPEGIVN